MRRIITQFRHFVEKGSWEEDLERTLEKLCWSILIVSAVYIGIGVLWGWWIVSGGRP